MRLRPGGGIRLRAVGSPLLEGAGFKNEGIQNGPERRALTAFACAVDYRVLEETVLLWVASTG